MTTSSPSISSLSTSLRPVCFITGASSGIGAALAVEYVKAGYSVVLTGRRQSLLDTLKGKLQQMDAQAEVLVLIADVCDDKRMKECFVETSTKFGRLDVLIANAGYVVGGKLEELSLQSYRDQLETNVFGVLHTIYPALDLLKTSKGRLAIIGSVNSYVSLPSVSPYAMSKYAVRALAESIHYELKPAGISVTMICPGFVKSDIRSRDSKGQMIEGRKDYVGRLAMDADVAAKKIKKSIDGRKRETVITLHGKFAVWLKRFFPSLVFLLFSLQNRKPKT